jgi:SAM-dependent methyltransferase
MPPDPTDEIILDELTALARGPAPELVQFASLASAHQYLGLYRLWRHHVPAGARALDWGAGAGHFSYFLLRAGYRATGFALQPAGFERWLPPVPFRFVVGDAREPARLPFEDQAFDAVASVGVLEHVHETGGDPTASLAEIARVLRPGGKFVCWHLPNRSSWIEFIARRMQRAFRHDRLFADAEIGRLVAGAGLELIEQSRYGVLPRNMLHSAFGALANSRRLTRFWNSADALLGRPLAPIAQNHCFVARRPQGPAGGQAPA